MAEGEREPGEGMLAAATIQGVNPKREEERLTPSIQGSEDECSSLDSCPGGTMGVPGSREPSPSTILDSKHHQNGLLNLSSMAGLGGTPSAPTMHQGHSSIPPIHSPLNLSINATNHIPGNNLISSPQQVITPQPGAMPQLFLASGQILQGIQGAQLLIPTSQGIATQTILTIPINTVSNNQMVNVNNINNGQAMNNTLAHFAHQCASSSSPTHGNLTSGAPPPPPLPHLLNGHSQHHQHLLNAYQQHTQHAQQQAAHLLQAQQAPQHPPPAPQQPPIQTQQQSPQLSLQHQPPIGPVSQKSPVGLPSFTSGVQNCSKSPPISMNGGSAVSPSPLGVAVNGSTCAPTSSTSPSSPISRLANSNNDLTITTTTGGGKYHHPVDLMDDSNQPTISESRGNLVDGINLDEIKEFAKAFKLRRLSLGLTQTQVGQALSITEGPAYSQSAICSALATQMYCAAQLASQQQSMFEKLDITPKSAQKIKPVLEQWMKEAEESRYKSGQNHLTEFIGVEPSKKRKRRTSFTPQALELLNAHFERNTHPSGTEITTLAHQLGYEREVIRIWFCNKRQALKNTVRMMSKGCT